MQRRDIFLVILASLIFVGGACASTGVSPNSGGPTGALLGQRSVDFGADRDVIVVGAKDGRFRALQLHNTAKSPMELWDIKVHFGNGKVWSPSTRLRFANNSWTRRIDLPGTQGRIIRKVVFLYKSRKLENGRAKIQLFGIH